MKFTLLTSSVIALTTLTPTISAHAFIYWAAGDADPNQGWALGYRTTTPTNGDDKPYKKSGGIKNDWYYMTKYVSNKPFIPIASEVQKMVDSNALPQVTKGGHLIMKIHQINADGAGAYRCFIDFGGAASYWHAELAVQWQVQFTGDRSTNAQGNLKNQQLRVKLPDNMSCGGSYGGRNNICMIRCQNSAPNGPFGGCVPVQEVQPPQQPPAEIPHQEDPGPPPQQSQQDADDYNGADNVPESYEYIH
ncbi:hypothetical protein TWF506_000547 [Arthrobotrys conoides]|uniref:Uncharacterized protein n=1 Tax=Arthrobotrys conoides TaxID=74498 RepID=A0AAN8NE54_9PEZI